MKIPSRIAAALVAAASAAAFGETNVITVLASRIGDPAADMPLSVNVLGHDDIVAGGGTDFPTVLERTGALEIRRLNGNPSQTMLSARGYGESAHGRILVIADGARLSQPDMSVPDLMCIAPDSISRIEILHGPQTVLYGDGASATLVNVLTDGDDLPDFRRASFTTGSHGLLSSSLRFRESDDSDVFSGGVSASRGNGFRRHSAFRAFNADASARRSWQDDSRVGVSVSASDSFAELPGALTEDEYRADRRAAKNGAANDDESRSKSLAVNAPVSLSIDDSRSLDLDLSLLLRSRTADWSGEWPSHQRYGTRAARATPRFTDETDRFGRENKFMLGADFGHERFESSTRSAYPSRNVFRKTSAAAYAFDAIHVTPGIIFSAGARSERFSMRYDDDSANDDDTLNAFELGATWKPSDDGKVFVRAARFYRLPFCDEANYTRDGNGLRPETGLYFNLGFDLRIAEEWRASVVAFRSVTEDEIFFNPHASEGWGYNENSPDDVVRNGLDAAVAWSRRRHADFTVSASLVDAEFDGGAYDGATVPLVPHAALSVRGSLFFTEKLAVRAGARFVSGERKGGDFENTQGRVGSHVVADAALSYGIEDEDPFTVTVSCDNVFDEGYCDYVGWGASTGSYFYPAAGRTFAVRATVSF